MTGGVSSLDRAALVPIAGVRSFKNCNLNEELHPMPITAAEKQTIVETYGKDAKDTGSPEVQVALLTARINQLTEHFAATSRTTTPAAAW